MQCKIFANSLCCCWSAAGQPLLFDSNALYLYIISTVTFTMFCCAAFCYAAVLYATLHVLPVRQSVSPIRVSITGKQSSIAKPKMAWMSPKAGATGIPRSIFQFKSVWMGKIEANDVYHVNTACPLTLCVWAARQLNWRPHIMTALGADIFSCLSVAPAANTIYHQIPLLVGLLSIFAFRLGPPRVNFWKFSKQNFLQVNRQCRLSLFSGCEMTNYSYRCCCSTGQAIIVQSSGGASSSETAAAATTATEQSGSVSGSQQQLLSILEQVIFRWFLAIIVIFCLRNCAVASVMYFR